MKLLENIFSVKNEDVHKVWTVLGFKFRFKNKLKQLEKNLFLKLDTIKLEQKMQQEQFGKRINSELKNTSKKLEKSILDRTNTIYEEYLSNQEEQIKFQTKQFSRLEIVEKSASIVNNDYNKSLYNLPVEIKHLQPFLPYYEKEDFVEKYQRLISGLDEESILNINKIIVNQRKCKDCEDKPIDIFSNDEKNKIERLRMNFNNLVIKLQENVFAYKEYLLPIRWFEECVFYYKHGIPELKFPERFKNKNIIDAGAFIGDSALVMSRYTNKNIYSFEMLPKHIDLINQTIKLNHLTNVIPVNKALGDKNEMVKININTSSTSIKEFTHAEILDTAEVEMVKLDDFVQENNLEVGLIKTDLEGAEQEFLRGAENTIRTQKPTLLISIYHNPSDLFEIKPLIESWNLGYKFRVLKQTEKIHLETMLVAEVEE